MSHSFFYWRQTSWRPPGETIFWGNQVQTKRGWSKSFNRVRNEHHLIEKVPVQLSHKKNVNYRVSGLNFWKWIKSTIKGSTWGSLQLYERSSKLLQGELPKICKGWSTCPRSCMEKHSQNELAGNKRIHTWLGRMRSEFLWFYSSWVSTETLHEKSYLRTKGIFARSKDDHRW